MNLNELDKFRLGDALKFHNDLNPKLWFNNRLRPEVQKQLKLIAQDFIEELGINSFDVKDLTISGSNAAYSYTPHSDLDLHILIDMNELPNNEVYRELFNAKKTIYNDSHNIKVHGVPVELYVQDVNQPVISLGEYSLLQNKWIKVPSKKRANFDQTATKAKYDKLHALIKHALKSKDLKIVGNVIKKIKQYRQAGLDKAGEFGPENLAYKILRNQDYITKLYDLRDKLHSDELTIETMYQQPGSTKLLDKPTLSVRALALKHNVTVKHILNQLKRGIEVESEHTTYAQTAREIALDHLAEDPNYYTKLKKAQLEEEKYDELPEKVYHVTLADNLGSIMSRGLIPQIGDRARKIEGEKPAVYCFPDKVSMEDAVMNWLGDEYDEDDQLALLEIDTTGLKGQVTDGAQYEVAITDSIPVDNIRILSRDLATPITESIELSNGKPAWRIRFERFKGLDSLLPERENKMYLMPLDKSALRTFGSLTGKDFDKIKNMPTEVYSVDGNAMVGDMYIINQIFRQMQELKQYKQIMNRPENAKNKQETLDFIEELKQEYLNTRVPYSEYRPGMFRFPEILAEPGQITKIENKGVSYDKNTGEIKLTDRRIGESASGYIPSYAERNDPRFKTALTVDIKPDTMKKNAKAFGNKISRAGIPPTLRPSGKF